MWVWPSGYRVASLLGPLLHGLLLAAALLPAIIAHFAISRIALSLSPSIRLILEVPLLYALYVFGVLLTVPLAVRLLGVFSREGRIDLAGVGFIRFSTYCGLHAIAQTHILHTVRNTALMVWYCRLMGAQVGSNCAIGSTLISDFNLLEIGDNTLLGYDVQIIPHLAEAGGVSFARIRIGSRVSIGNGTMVLPGTTIEDDVVVGANALVPKGAHLKRGGVYVGSPVRPLSSRVEAVVSAGPGQV